MNGRKAKAIRRIVYGDMSLRVERQYKVTTFVKTIKGLFDKDNKEKQEKSHTFRASGLRGDYRMIKKMVRENHRTIGNLKKEVEQKFAF